MLNKFNQMKDVYTKKRQLDAMNKQMEQIVVKVNHQDFEITMQGDQKVVSVYENGVERKDLRELFNKAQKESKKKVAKKMRGQMSELVFPGL